MITPLLLAEVTLPADHPRANGGAYPVYGFVIHHPEGPILVDTGVGESHPGIDDAYRPVRHDPVAALGRVGVGWGEVRMVINSHLHFDHCGGNPRLPGVPLVAQAAELEAATGLDYTVPEWVWFPGAEWRPVDGESEVADGVRVIPTPSHTPGHQSVVVERHGSVEVIAAQAMHDAEELVSGVSFEALDGAAVTVAESARRILDLGPRRVYFSHDAGVWESA